MQATPDPVTDSVRVLLLQDSEAAEELIRDELDRSDLKVVYERADCQTTFVAALRKFAPHIVLSSHSGGELDVPGALALLREIRPVAPLIVVTDKVTGAEAVACVRAGVEDVVLTENLRRLASAIKRALLVRQSLVRLTRRQIEVLKLVAEGRRTREIAKELKLSVKTVESHRGEVMKRLGVRDVVSLVHYALRVGLVPSTT